MKVELVDLEEFSGNKAHIYSVLLDDAEDTLFDQFVEENGPLYPNEIREIVKELIAMGNKVGCQEHFFKLYLECRNNPKQPKISKYKPLFIRIF